jgi:hypothetical protein
MMALFNRVISVDFKDSSGSTFTTPDLRIKFDIQKTREASSNTAKLQIYNLSEASRNRIRELDDSVIVRAGYTQDAGAKIIFTGDVTKINHEFQPPDVISLIECGDGIKNLREQRDSVSFGTGTKADIVLKDLATKMGLPLRPLPQGLTNEYVTGFSHVGSTKDALNKITDRLDLEWSIQNGELQILKKREPVVGVPVQVNFTRGLLEQPERLRDIKANLIGDKPKPGYKIRMLLTPELIPGGRINLTEGTFPGEFRIERVNHVGDNFDNDFYSEMEVTEI